MKEVAVGLIALGVGGLLCFGGYMAARVVLALYGAFVGFMLGAGIVASASGDGFFQTGAAWLVGLVVAAVFMLLSYAFYELALVIALGAAGFILSAALLTLIGVDWNWLVGLIAGAVGVVVALAAFVYDLPKVLLIVVTTLTGAAIFTNGLLLLFGSVGLDSYRTGGVSDHFRDSWAWLIVWGLVVVSGMFVQWRSARVLGSRDAWDQ